MPPSCDEMTKTRQEMIETIGAHWGYAYGHGIGEQTIEMYAKASYRVVYARHQEVLLHGERLRAFYAQRDARVST